MTVIHKRFRVARILAGALIAAVALTASPASAAPTTVDGTSNLFAAGLAPGEIGVLLGEDAFSAWGGLGTVPVAVPLPPLPGVGLRFTGVTGTVNCCAGDPSFDNGPEGLIASAPEFPIGTDINSVAGISGLVHHDRFLFLSGVFTGNDRPLAPAPARLDFSGGGDNFAALAPEIGQTFFIGDGLTGDGIGAPQTFIAPAGATALHLGFVDSPPWGGGPCCYDDNPGSLALDVGVDPATITPIATAETFARAGAEADGPWSGQATSPGSEASSGSMAFQDPSGEATADAAATLADSSDPGFVGASSSVSGSPPFNGPPFDPTGEARATATQLNIWSIEGGVPGTPVLPVDAGLHVDGILGFDGFDLALFAGDDLRAETSVQLVLIDDTGALTTVFSGSVWMNADTMAPVAEGDSPGLWAVVPAGGPFDPVFEIMLDLLLDDILTDAVFGTTFALQLILETEVFMSDVTREATVFADFFFTGTATPAGGGPGVTFASTALLTPAPTSAQVPEPATLALLGFGLMGLAFLRRRRRANA